MAVSERPRNPEVEQAWREYAIAFQASRAVLSTMSNYSLNAYGDVAIVLNAKQKKEASDVALWNYLEIYDADQRERGIR